MIINTLIKKSHSLKGKHTVFKTLINSVLIILIFQSTLFSKNVDINKTLNQLQGTKKHLLIYFHRTGCSYCNAMEVFTFDDETVKKYINKYFVFVSINISENDTIKYKKFQGDGKSFMKLIGFGMYPSYVFLNKSANIDYRDLGYYPEDEFLVILKFVNTNSFKTMDLDDYKEKVNFKEKERDLL